ncbi:mannitol-1-phosphate 5-dehydrogenase [Catenisphaera adipataccumulans]|jgi:mannitol-1-phosphate 5-dehydrogenase|uniref:Mannitol-1-phosphate 5-dehydrogenase n=1 Tax=Catenisphaera adipataccumulans TaxID=700500 RepID=A0A7W8CW94_9FIRM|nr:mannitol-1-phosphate 5-dehydrogenase [Catenisphaera adipataccumulans]MBB5182745.1 mannitol-1-phosphate 5-dehydrogenase [Catenisphaera adipataccumulans]
MKTAVHFGAGKIGKGFIGDLLHDSGYDITFVDVNQSVVDTLNKDHQYSLFLLDHDYKEKVIDHVKAYFTNTDYNQIIEEIANAEIVTTSVMATNLVKIAPLLADGLKSRLNKGKKKVVVMACENAIMGTDMLKKAMIDSGNITEEQLDEVGVYPNTAVDRMVFEGNHHGKNGIEIDDDYELVIEANKLDDLENKPIKNAEYVKNLGMYLERKIYMVNCGHTVTSYFGYIKGYKTIQDSLKDPELVDEMKKAVMESASALEREYGFKHEDLVSYYDKMIINRYTTPGIADPVTRVAREPIRKIAPNERIMGPAIKCEKYGLDNEYLLKACACALAYKYEKDKQAVTLQKFIAENGVEAAIKKYIGLDKNDRMTKRIVEIYNSLV